VIELIGDIFQQRDADAICFTSNGIVKSDGTLTMGAGIAKSFRDRYTHLKFVIDRITEKQKKEANEVVVADEVICEWNIKHSACFCSRPSYRDKYGFQHNEVITWVPERVCGI
jgi:hypothetical protein